MLFQDLRWNYNYWGEKGCLIMEPYDIERGWNYELSYFLRALGTRTMEVVYVESSRRPADARYGENPNRLYQHHQLQ